MTNNYEIRGNIAVIYLKKKDGSTYETMIDVSDLEKAKSITGAWYTCFKGNTHYVVTLVTIERRGRRDNKMTTTTSLHRFLYENIPPKMVIDHMNHNTLDNRRSVNLRVVTHSENRLNSKKSYLASKNTA